MARHFSSSASDQKVDVVTEFLFRRGHKSWIMNRESWVPTESVRLDLFSGKENQ